MDIETLIRRASMLLYGGLLEVDVISKLTDTGASVDGAYLAVKAALIFNKDLA